MSTLSVVEQILRSTAVPMSVKEIVERAGAELPTKSKTPDTVVARDLSMDIKKKGEASIFIRTSPGRYAMREQQAAQQVPALAAQPEQATPTTTTNTTTPITEQVGENRAPTKAAVHPELRSEQSDTASA